MAKEEGETGKIIKDNTQEGVNVKARRMLFDELLNVRTVIAQVKPKDMDFEVVSDEEINQIRVYWAQIDNLKPWREESIREDTAVLFQV